MREFGAVKLDGLNLRASPGNGAIIDELNHGDRLVVHEHRVLGQYEWLRVTAIATSKRDEEQGWVAARFVGLSKPEPPPLPNPAPQPPEHDLTWWVLGGLAITGLIVFVVAYSFLG